MKNILSRAALTVVACSLLASLAFAETQKAPSTHKAKATCPVCKMSLSAKKDKMHTVAVRLKKGGPVMYCCAGCKMPASVIVKKHPVKKAVAAAG